MDNDEGPNFAYAYGGATSTASPASWNPALRPDSESTPSATRPSEEAGASIDTKSATEPVTDTREPDEIEDSETKPTRIADESTWDPNADDDFFSRVEGNHTIRNVPQPSGGSRDGEDGFSQERLVNGLQNLGLKDEQEEEFPHGPNGASEQLPSPSGVVPADPHTTEELPAENYEHQGDATVLEEALSENAMAPLVPDTESATDDWGESGEVFDLGGKPQDAPSTALGETPLPTPQAGTSMGDEFIGNSTIGGNSGEEIDWGNTDDSDLFGAGPAADAAAATGEGSGWDLALDDDFLPDTEDVAAPIDLDDDEGFLEDEPSDAVQQAAQPTQPIPSTSNRYVPHVEPVPQPSVNPYAPQTPAFTDLSQANQPKVVGTPNVAYGAYAQPSPYQQQPPRPPMASSAESFAAKSKGGYHSPYDLPEDVVTTRRRPAPRPSTGPLGQPAHPPPRTSSAYASSTAAPPRPPPPAGHMSTGSLTPPSSSHSTQNAMTGIPPPSKPASSQATSSDFFAELPITTKPKPPGRYTPQSAVSQHTPGAHAPPPPPVGFPKERTGSWSSLRNEVFPDGENLALRQPERLPVFPEQPAVPVRANTLPMPAPAPAAVPSRYSPQPPPAPSANNRYSPAPPSAGANARYSPAPPQQPPAHNRYASEPSPGLPRTTAQPYAPRTSSPLAYHAKAHGQETSHTAPAHVPQQTPGHDPSESGDGASFKGPLQGVNEVDEGENHTTVAAAPSMAPRTETPPPRSTPSSAVASPRKTSNYAPQQQSGAQISASGVASPSRLMSYSPESTMKQSPRQYMPPENTAPMYNVAPTGAHFGASAMNGTVNVIPHKRQVSHDFAYIAPTDERAVDPLERWKGYPIFTWGFGGTVVTSFPKQIPRYGGGASAPMLKSSLGEIKVQNIKTTCPFPEDVSNFPGPLKAKSKKKDVLSWLGKKIGSLEDQLKSPGFELAVGPQGLTRFEEKILLWKILQVMVEHDGHLESNAAAEAAVRKVLAPEGDPSISDGESSMPTAADLVGGMRKASGSLSHSEPINPRALDDLSKLLTMGDREKAVWHAVDQRLWGHAMLLSSTLDKSVWKQVIQEFVRKEVKNVGRNNQALAVLYEIFAGNFEDCIDELVPASARAGFQMVSTDGTGPTQNALQGLDKWRDTLSLVLNNRSTGDAQALLSLGRLLAGYGRVEAAHICFIFARPLAYIGGVDDAQSDIVLLGADHRADPLALGSDIEPILLTEVYEFALSLSAPSGSHIIPHLQNYKLIHAYTLAEYGNRSEAQAYCDAIATAMKSTTKISPYYNGGFIARLDDLSKRLSQSPKDGSSWISKPSMDKVSSSLLSKFNSFIAGDDDDAASNHSAGAEVGPFARIAGNTPTISPSQSQADLYGAAYGSFGGSSAPPSVPTNSRYAPRTSMEKNTAPLEAQGRPSIESQSSNRYLPSPSLSGPYTPSQPQFSPPTSKAQTYAPLKSPPATSSYGSPYQPTQTFENEPNTGFGGYQPPQTNHDEASQVSSSYEPPSMGGYEPPTSSYEPPSYEPYNPDEETKSGEEEPKKKKSFMDDDDEDDLAARAAALKAKQKSEADRKADEAFRKAAEADAQKGKDSGKKGGGWLSSWFKKDPNASSGPIKAKLGEENSFYYDPDLKKWVNKKAGATETAKSATPPPPKSGPPSRSVSDMGAPPPGPMGPPPSAPASAPFLPPPTSNPQRSSSMPPPMGVPPLSRASTPGMASGDEAIKPPVLTRPPLVAGTGPPSRPSTGMSTASSIDDLLGAPAAKKGTAKGKKKGGARYVDIMAQK